MKINTLTLSIFAVIFFSCEPNLDYKIKGYTQKIIVEGSIASNEFPKVYLSLNNPTWQKVDSATILKNVIRVAKVTVSDGTKTEILTSSWEKDHFPPYVYKGTELKGEEGKTYFLKVEYGGYTVESKTTIPFGTTIDRFETKPLNDTLRTLYMTFNINPLKKTSYRVFTKKKKDRYFTETKILFNSELSLFGSYSYCISPTPRTTDASYNEGSNFVAGDSVLVRFCAIDSTSTQFFKDLSLLSPEYGIGSSLFIGEKKSLNSNITEPGFGIWWGAAVRSYNVIIK